jgi:hypothetical protein
LQAAHPQGGLDGTALSGIGGGPVDVVQCVDLHETVKGELFEWAKAFENSELFQHRLNLGKS